MSTTAAGFVFNARVSDTHSSGGRVYYRIQLETNQPQFVTASVSRSFTDFNQLRAALQSLPGGSDLPALPAKTLFVTSVERRMVCFNAFLHALSVSEQLVRADATVAFFTETPPPPPPDYAAIRRDILTKAKDVVALGQAPAVGSTIGDASVWQVRYNKKGIEIATAAAPNSSIYYVRSRLQVDGVAVPRAFQLYTDADLWSTYLPDAMCCEVDRMSATASVLHVTYKLPIVADRDVVLYQEQLLAQATLAELFPGEVVPAAAVLAASIQHPAVPPPAGGIIRAKLLIATTLFTPVNGGTCILSHQHADPGGLLPAACVNACVLQGKTQLKAMRRVMLNRG